MVVDVQNFELWSSTIDDILNLSMRKTDYPDGTLTKGTVKLLFATVPDVSESKMFKRINCLLDYKFDLSDMPLEDDEKIEMIKKYLTNEQISAKLPESLNFQRNIFPLLCKLSSGKTAEQIIKLFTNHKEVIKHDFLGIKQKNKHQICLIGLCVLLKDLKENVFDEEITSQRDNIIIKNVCLEFDLDISKENHQIENTRRN
ncbi:unnamed protein product [Mytilus edulis]|uniref:Uncharacterized protein n=1 Tax=Mytilus edulis TaxID=6550 RepID=A0A8S3UWL7_MYTED|nr:unnamed protein product [Mytilus edulis]